MLSQEQPSGPLDSQDDHRLSQSEGPDRLADLQLQLKITPHSIHPPIPKPPKQKKPD
jgi:hypothetical protein